MRAGDILLTAGPPGPGERRNALLHAKRRSNSCADNGCSAAHGHRAAEAARQHTSVTPCIRPSTAGFGLSASVCFNVLVTTLETGDAARPVRHGVRRPRKHPRLRIALIAAVSVLAVLAVAVGLFVTNLSTSFDRTEKIVEAFPEETLRPAPVESDAQNILLLGSDTRGAIEGSLDAAVGNRADAIMVVHIPADRENIQVMSIMRDSWVDIPGQGQAKVNAALAYGGVPLMVQTAETLIDSRVDRVALIDFEGFRGLTEALGGVVVDNPVPFTTKGFEFAQGAQELRGEQALAFVRERYSFRDGDYQRVRNQQLFMKAVMDKTLTAETLANPVTVSKTVGSISPYMAVDAGFSSAYAADLGLGLRDIRSSDVKFFTMPTLGTGTANGQSIVKVDFAELETIKALFRADTLDEYEPKPKP